MCSVERGMQGKAYLSHLGLFISMWLWVWVIRWGGIKSSSNIFPMKRQRHQRMLMQRSQRQIQLSCHVLLIYCQVLIIIAMAGKVSQKGEPLGAVPAGESRCNSLSVLSNHSSNFLYCVELTKWNKCKLLFFPTDFLMFMALMWKTGWQKNLLPWQDTENMKSGYLGWLLLRLKQRIRFVMQRHSSKQVHKIVKPPIC